MQALPSGTVTFLFTDIEGSTARWESAPAKMKADLETHNAILDAVMAEYGGAVFKTIGDAYCVAFANADEAAAAAMHAQARLALEDGGIRVRMGVHTGSIDPCGGDYFGQPVNRTARIMAIGSGGQILASEATKALLSPQTPLRSLGRQILKDLMEPIALWQVGGGEFRPLRGLDAVANNLPIQMTSFVGRKSELEHVQTILSKSRFVTLTGTGGTGKSRLSLQLAAENIDHFPDGVWFVELAAIPEREDLLREVIATIGASDVGTTAIERIAAHFRERTSCLILDNCEHVLSIASDLAERLIRSCPLLTVITTSREPLGAAGEAVYRVPSLAAPQLHRGLTMQELDRFGACALFIDRLSTAAPEYGLQEEDAVTIVKICNRLDGIPLALELAAARGRSMRLDQVEQRLDNRFRLLTGGSRNALSRQQTLQALIDWSVQLLNEKERNIFAGLSVFAGGWQLEAAEAICGCEALGVEAWEVLDYLTALVDKSLVIFEHSSGRYKMLESLRQYAADLFSKSEWALLVRDRQADFYIQYADPGLDAVMVLPADRQTVFAADYENIRSALEWSRGEPERAARAARVAARLWPGYMMVDRSAELVRLLEPLIEAASPLVEPEEKQRFQITLAIACARVSDVRAVDMLEGEKDAFKSLPMLPRLRAVTALGYAYFRVGRFRESIELMSPFTTLEVGPENHYFAYVFTMLGLDYACVGDFDQAESCTERACTELLLRADRRGWGAAKANLATIAVLRGRYAEAVRHACQLICASDSKQVNPKARTMMLSVFGAAAFDQGIRERGAILVGGGFAGLSEEFDSNDPLDSRYSDHVLQMYQKVFDPIELRRLMEEGRILDWEPWIRALSGLDGESLFAGGKFVLPFPELISKTAT
jgi:predicted ATPase/class 3 adenylate cyclase